VRVLPTTAGGKKTDEGCAWVFGGCHKYPAIDDELDNEQYNEAHPVFHEYESQGVELLKRSFRDDKFKPPQAYDQAHEYIVQFCRFKMRFHNMLTDYE
jgi:hypothetical protein